MDLRTGKHDVMDRRINVRGRIGPSLSEIPQGLANSRAFAYVRGLVLDATSVGHPVYHHGEFYTFFYLFFKPSPGPGKTRKSDRPTRIFHKTEKTLFPLLQNRKY